MVGGVEYGQRIGGVGYGQRIGKTALDEDKKRKHHVKDNDSFD